MKNKMATTTVAINLEAKTKGTDSVKSLKAQIREATNEATELAQKFGDSDDIPDNIGVAAADLVIRRLRARTGMQDISNDGTDIK